MRAVRIYLRYYPPCICLEYQDGSGATRTKEIDLPTLGPDTNVRVLVESLTQRESRLRSKKMKQKLVGFITTLVERQKRGLSDSYTEYKAMKPHPISITNCACNKSGTLVATASYDQTCKILCPGGSLDGAFPEQMETGDPGTSVQVKSGGGTTARSTMHSRSGPGREVLHTLSGHKNVVYGVAFNNPFGNRVVTASFDKTAKIWDVVTGKEIFTYVGHDRELVGVSFSSDAKQFATCSTDTTCRLWDVQHGDSVATLRGHSKEISHVSYCYSNQNTNHPAQGVSASKSGSSYILVTASCDNTVRLWDARLCGANSSSSSGGGCVSIYDGHNDEVCKAEINHEGNLVLSCSSDGTAKVWDLRMNTNSAGGLGGGIGDSSKRTKNCIFSLTSADGDEVSDCCFNFSGTLIATCGKGGDANMYDSLTGVNLASIQGHRGPVVRVGFNPQGTKLLTCGEDSSVRLWEARRSAANVVKSEESKKGGQRPSLERDCFQVLEGHSDEVFGFCFNYGGDTLFTVSKDNTCRVWKHQIKM